MTPPNVVMILTDDQGYGDVASHGNPWLQTPHLDALREDAVRLTDFHVDPMCAPTRAGLMTGRCSARTGVWSTLTGRYIMRADETTMGDVFRTSGYATGLFGKWHLGDSWPYRPQDRGFQETLSFGGGVVGEIPDYWDNDYFSATYLRNGVPEPFDDRYCTDLWFDEATTFIDRHCHEPFFCYIPTNAPHSPFNVHARYSDPYAALGIPEERAWFYGMITCIDENIGRLREHLSDAGLTDNTILIFMGDNGTACGCGLDREGFLTDGFNAGLRGKKCWAFEGGHRNSCFVHWPAGGLTGGRDVDCLSAQIDLLPTLIDLCGLRSPDLQFDGRSIVPMLHGQTHDHDDARVLCVHNQQRDTSVKYSWPEEADAPIRSAVPPRRDVPFVDDFVPGEALSVVEARIEIGGTGQSCAVRDTDTGISFRVSLPEGRTRLETFLTDEHGIVRGAYYVYARRL